MVTDGRNKTSFVLMMADSSLMMAQQLCRWSGRCPSLELDVTLSNIILDQMDLARQFYQQAADFRSEEEGFMVDTEDTLAFQRNEKEFSNLLICEVPNGNWGQSVLKIFFFSVWQKAVFDLWMHSGNETFKHVPHAFLDYHILWSRNWVKRLAQGTEESHSRMQQALDSLWCYTNEMRTAEDYEETVLGRENLSVSGYLQDWWNEHVTQVLSAVGLAIPQTAEPVELNGKQGGHTGFLAPLLREMQHVQRAHPGLEW